MFKLSLVLLLVCSTFFCQANPVDTTHHDASVSDPTKPADKPLNSTPVIPATPKKENDTAKVGPVTTKPLESSSIPSATENPIPPITNATSPPITTPHTTVTPATSSEATTKPAPPPPTTTPKPITTSSSSPPSSSTLTPKPVTTTHSPPTSTMPPAPTTAHPKPNPDGGFNLISFLGGMILGLGLLAIGYVIFKFYQTRRDSSYRTL